MRCGLASKLLQTEHFNKRWCLSVMLKFYSWSRVGSLDCLPASHLSLWSAYGRRSAQNTHSCR